MTNTRVGVVWAGSVQLGALLVIASFAAFAVTNVEEELRALTDRVSAIDDPQAAELEVTRTAALLIKEDAEWRAQAAATAKAWQERAKRSTSLPFAVGAIAVHRALGNAADEADAMVDAGIVCSDLRRPDCSRGYTQAGLEMARQSGSLFVEGRASLNLGVELTATGEHAQARQHLQRGLQIMREVGDRGRESAALMGLARILTAEGRLNEALAQQDAAIAVARAAGDGEREALALYERAGIEQRLSRPEQAILHLQAALLIYRERDLRSAQSDTLRELAIASCAARQLKACFEYHRQSIELAQQLGDKGREVENRVRMGLAYVDVFEFAAALAQLEHALQVAREASDRRSEAYALTYLGYIYGQSGDLATAQGLLERARTIATELGYHALEDEALLRSAAVDRALGAYGKALDRYSAVQRNSTSRGDRYREAAATLNMAILFSDLGQHAKALEGFKKVYPLAVESGDLAMQASVLRNVGALFVNTGQHAEALQWLSRARDAHRTLGDPAGEAMVYANLAAVYDNLEKSSEAADYYRRALVLLRSVGDRNGQSNALTNWAVMAYRLGDYNRAADLARQGLIIGDELGALERQWRASQVLSRSLMQLDRGDEGLFFGKRAVNAIQSLRVGASNLDTQYQATLLAGKRRTYQALADSLIERGRLAEAQQVLLMFKEEEFFDFIRRDAANDPRSARLAYTTMEIAIAARYDEISAQLASLAREYALLARLPEEVRSPVQRARYVALQKDLDVATARYRTFLKEIEATFRDQGKRNTYPAQLAELEALQSTLADLGEGVVLVHYLMTEDRLRILVTTPDIQLHRESDIGEAALNKLIFAYRATLQDPRLEARPQAQALYEKLLMPIAKDLEQAGARTLMFSLDGAMRYVPMAALNDGQQWLIERYAISIYTSAARSQLGALPQENWQVAALGVSAAADGFSALPAVPFELDSIVRESRANDFIGVLPGSVILDTQFTEQALRAALEQRNAVVHIASHFRFTPGTSDDSYLLVGNNGRVSLTDLQNAHYRFANVDLLTLSACETALGDGNGRGVEVEGLAATVQTRGARSVLATLWSVADASTGLFMRELYRRHQQLHLNKAEAVRKAQLALLRGEVKAEELPEELRRTAVRDDPASLSTQVSAFRPDPAAPYGHPFYWAPFILMGNWR